MARIADTDRILRLLDGDGGSLGRREIIEGLGITDERYEEVANQLVAKKQVTKNRGRTGGLRLTSQDSARDAEAPDKTTGLERDLYAPFAGYLVATAARSGESRSVILDTHNTHARKWETPDLTEVRVTPFPAVGQWELRIIAYELKRQGAWSVDSVLQAATYREFAHESWLVVPAREDEDEDLDWVEHFTKRVVDQAGTLGVGLATLNVKTNALKKHTTPPRGQAPTLSRQQEWLDNMFELLREPKKRSEIADNIGWASRKAGAGRD